LFLRGRVGYFWKMKIPLIPYVFMLISLIITPCFTINLPKPTNVKLDMCTDCVELMNETIEQLIEYIANSGVIGGCTAICTVTGVFFPICELICDYVGIEVFVDVINKTDPDPIYICQLFGVCGHVDGGKVNIISATVDPKSGPQGTVFNITMVYKVLNNTGPGLLVVDIIPPDTGFPISEAEFTEGEAIGEYAVGWSLQATPAENEPFSAGVYLVGLGVCEGDCNTIHEWSGVYAMTNTTFKITGSN